MFRSYQAILTQASENESSIIDSFKIKKESKALEIKEALVNESKKITTDKPLTDYNPNEIYNLIGSLNLHHQNIKTEEKNGLRKLKIETEQILIQSMEYKLVLPIKEIYKDIYCSDNGNCWVCRVWFSLENFSEINIKAGDPFKIAWFDINVNRDKEIKNYAYHNQVVKKREIELDMPDFTNKYSLTNPKHFYSINHFGENSRQKTDWLEWVKQNRPI